MIGIEIAFIMIVLETTTIINHFFFFKSNKSFFSMIHWNKNERPGPVRTGGRAVEVKVKKDLADESKEVLFFIIYLILIYIFIITFYLLYII